jgi:serine/threonine protein kinase
MGRVGEIKIEPGVCLSGHLISAEIGKGGFSRVFRADPVAGGPSVAIKVAVRSELVDALRSEGAVLRRLSGPRFVKILEEHLEDDPPYFVLELCDGDLRAHLDAAPGKRIAPDQALAIMKGVLEGCAFAHDEGVVHGDLKPENVLLTRRKAEHQDVIEPKIADLGLSRAHRRKLVVGERGVVPSVSSGESKVRGTFDYLAPETRKGDDISPASDVFALGVTFYEMLTGKRPLGVFQLPRAVLAKEGVELPKAIDRVIGRALAHDTSERYPDASIMLADLLAGDEGLTWASEAQGPSRAPKLVRVQPVNDFVFAVHMYTAIVVPLLAFGLVGNAIRFHVDSLDARKAIFFAALAILVPGLIRVAWTRLREVKP